jgi:transposase
MATLVAARFNPLIRSFYQQVCLVGKAKKVALAACMRKLLTIINALCKHQTHGIPQWFTMRDSKDSCCPTFMH